MVRRDRRNAAPVVDTGAQYRSQLIRGTQVGRGLDRHLGTQDQPRDGDGPQVLVERRFGMMRHARAGLRPEILNDDFLDMVVPAMTFANCNQCVDLLRACFSDAYQQPCGERNTRTAGGFDCLKAARRQLVRRTVMRAAFLRQSIRCGFQH